MKTNDNPIVHLLNVMDAEKDTMEIATYNSSESAIAHRLAELDISLRESHPKIAKMMEKDETIFLSFLTSILLAYKTGQVCAGKPDLMADEHAILKRMRVEVQEHLKPAKLIKTFYFSISLASLMEITKENAVGIIQHSKNNKWFDQPLNGEVRINYPIQVDVYLKIENCLSIGELLWDITRAYEEIFQEPEKYGVQNHVIEELGFERIFIHSNGIIELGIGS